jgi:hypothetical protein
MYKSCGRAECDSQKQIRGAIRGSLDYLEAPRWSEHLDARLTDTRQREPQEESEANTHWLEGVFIRELLGSIRLQPEGLSDATSDSPRCPNIPLQRKENPPDL